jgi:hypothetical protein
MSYRTPLKIALIAAAAALLTPAAVADEPNLSSPRTAVKSLYDAVQAQDGDAILKTFYAPTEPERDLARAFADVIVAGKRLRDAAKERYGSTGEALASGMMTREEFARIDQAELKETSPDSATLAPVGRTRAIPFHKSADGHWQIVVRDFASPDQDLPRQTVLLNKMSTVFNDVATEIRAGKYPTSPAAEAVIQSRLATAMIKAATQRTTQPASRAATRP